MIYRNTAALQRLRVFIFLSENLSVRYGLEIAAFLGDLVQRLAVGNPAEDLLLVPADLFDTQQNVVSDVAGDAHDAVAVGDDHVAGPDGDVADFDGDLVVGDEAPAQAAVGSAVAVVEREILRQDLLGVADAAIDAGGTNAFGFWRRRS
jgi:hypothetical protein